MFTINRLTCLSNNQKLYTLLDSFYTPLPLSTQTYLKINFFISIHGQMLTQACIQSEYYEKVIDAVRFYTRTTREGRTFETLVNLMYKRPISPQFQVKQTYFPFRVVDLHGLLMSFDMMIWTCYFFYLFQTLCLAFFNSLIGITPTFNKKVFHQQEIEDAGFDVERLERVIHVYFMHVNIVMYDCTRLC